MKLMMFTRPQHFVLGAAIGIQTVVVEAMLGAPPIYAAFFGIVLAIAVAMFCALERRDEYRIVWDSATEAAEQVVQKKVNEANATLRKMNAELRDAYQQMLDKAIARERGQRSENVEDFG